MFPLAVSLPLAELGTAGVIGRCTLLKKRLFIHSFQLVTSNTVNTQLFELRGTAGIL